MMEPYVFLKIKNSKVSSDTASVSGPKMVPFVVVMINYCCQLLFDRSTFLKLLQVRPMTFGNCWSTFTVSYRMYAQPKSSKL